MNDSKMKDNYQGGRQHSFARHHNSSKTKLEENHAPEQELNTTVPKSDNFAIEISGVSKEYRQGRSAIEVLKNVSLSVKSGEIIGIVGASGSGKSTLLHIAGLLDQKFTGSVSIDGCNVRHLPPRHLDRLRLQHLGFIYQYHHLLSDFNARENVAMPQIIAGKPRDHALACADALYSRRNNQNT